MSRRIWLAATAWVAAAALAGFTLRGEAASARAAAPRPASNPAPIGPIVKQYCVTCHNARTKSGGLTLEDVDATNIPANAEIWEQVVRKLQRRAMPPQGARRPDPATYDAVLTSLEQELDHQAVEHPYPGQPLPHRLNRAEYANAIRDLLTLDLGDVSTMLPPDDSAFGFDNVAEALGFSAVLLERYVSVAGRLSALAVGERDVATGSDTFVMRQDYSQDEHVDGQPFGTIGGMLRRYTFPVDAEYQLSASLMRTNVDAPRGLEDTHQVEFTIDGERVFLTSIGGGGPVVQPASAEARANPVRMSRGDAVDAQLRVRIPVKAGPHEVGAAFLQRSLGENTRRLQPYRSSLDSFDATGMPQIRTLSITGPLNATGPGDTPSRRRIFVCRPANAAGEERCASRILATLLHRAYRGQETATDAQRLMGFYRAGRKEMDFDRGIERALQRVLASPKFLVRVEHAPVGTEPGAVYGVSQLDLASRLSFFLWSSMPDDELLKIATEGRLRNPAVFEQQVRRMLADPRADAIVQNFAGQWLQLRNLKNSVPNEDLFPEFDDNLRQSFVRETELFFESVMREDRNVVDLLTADYTFVNERLARHYQMPNIYGSRFRRVPVTDEARRGLLGQGSILTSTSNANRTSPAVRGKWILTNLVGMPPSPPPPDVPALKETADDGRVLTMRQQMERHRQNAVCASCHQLMDPLGFALENFDAVGSWRTADADVPIDASGVFLDGTALNGVATLRKALLSRPEVFVGTFVEKLLTYAVGRGLDYHDMPAIRQIVKESAGHDFRFSSLIMGIVTSAPFQQSMAPRESVGARSAAN
jgi:mono/diheme cytochrome c family protein